MTKKTIRVVAVFAGAERQPGACEIYRVTMPLYYLGQQEGWECGWIWLGTLWNKMYRNGPKVWAKFFEENDIFIFPRAYSVNDLSKFALGGFFDIIRKYGKRIVYETDDDYTNEVRTIIDGNAMLVAQMCDAVTVTTPYLRDRMWKHVQRPYHILPNCISPADFIEGNTPQRKPGLEDKLVIGLTGSATHQDDWRVLEDVVPKILEENPNVILALMGHYPDYFYDHKRLITIPAMHYHLYTKVLRTFDLILAPVIPDDKFNLGKCVTGDTRIATRRGLLLIKEVHSKEGVFTLEGLVQTTAKHHFQNRAVLRLRTKRGYSIAGTPEHRIQVNGQWKQMGELELGEKVDLHPVEFSLDYLDIPFNTWAIRRKDVLSDMLIAPVSSPRIQFDENYGLLIGAILGDGHVSGLGIRITCFEEDKDWMQLLIDTVARIGIPAKAIPSSGSRRCWEVRIHAKRFSEFLIHVGVWGGSIGRTGNHHAPKEFRVPEVIWQSPKSVVAAFLRGLFEADASVFGTGFEFVTKSKNLAEDVQILLLGFGIISKVITKHNKAYSRNYFTIAFGRDGLDKFVKEIGFASSRKIQKAQEITSKPHSNALKKMEWQDEIVLIEEEEADVYDITVPGQEHYLANGFVSHNSSIKAVEGMAARRMLPNGKNGGAAVLATNNPVYALSIKDGKTGVLVEHTESDWYDKLTKVIRDDEFRYSLQEKGHRWVYKHHDISQEWRQWARAFKKVLASPANPTPIEFPEQYKEG